MYDGGTAMDAMDVGVGFYDLLSPRSLPPRLSIDTHY